MESALNRAWPVRPAPTVSMLLRDSGTALEPPVAMEPLLLVTDGAILPDGPLAEDLDADEATPPAWPDTEESPAPVVSA